MFIDVRHITRCENYPKSSLMGRREENIYIYIVLILEVGKKVSGLQE